MIILMRAYIHRQRVSTIFWLGKTLTNVSCAPNGVRISDLWISSPTLCQLSHPVTPSQGRSQWKSCSKERNVCIRFQSGLANSGSFATYWSILSQMIMSVYGALTICNGSARSCAARRVLTMIYSWYAPQHTSQKQIYVFSPCRITDLNLEFLTTKCMLHLSRQTRWQFCSALSRNIALHNMLCLLPGPLAY